VTVKLDNVIADINEMSAKECYYQVDPIHYNRQPQYVLTVDAKHLNCVIWLCAVRHWTNSKNEDLIALDIFQSDGECVLFSDITRVNTCSYEFEIVATKLDVDPTVLKNDGSNKFRFTIVVGHLAYKENLNFSLRAFGNVPFELKPAPKPRFSHSITGVWDETNAGGAYYNFQSYKFNPTISLHFNEHDIPTDLLLICECRESYPINLSLYNSSILDGSMPQHTTSYCPTQCYLRRTMMTGNYILVPSTLVASQFGVFTITVHSSVVDFKLEYCK